MKNREDIRQEVRHKRSKLNDIRQKEQGVLLLEKLK